MSGGAVPVENGLVLSLERMNRILEIDTSNSVALVEAGVINGQLGIEADKYGLFYPVNPASMDSCTIGGNVATSAGGANAVRYGTTGNYVSGLEAILPDGDHLVAGGRLMKNATDQRLIQLLLGSEGTLALITKVILRLIPKPEATVVLIIPFNDVEPLSQVVDEIFRMKITPTMVESRATFMAFLLFLSLRRSINAFMANGIKA